MLKLHSQGRREKNIEYMYTCAVLRLCAPCAFICSLYSNIFCTEIEVKTHLSNFPCFTEIPPEKNCVKFVFEYSSRRIPESLQPEEPSQCRSDRHSRSKIIFFKTPNLKPYIHFSLPRLISIKLSRCVSFTGINVYFMHIELEDSIQIPDSYPLIAYHHFLLLFTVFWHST